MRQLTYTVGWYTLTPEELEELPPEYRAQAQGITTFGRSEFCFFDTPGEAQWFLDQIVLNNSGSNLRTLVPSGAEGLFLVQRERTQDDLGHRYRFSKYAPPGGAHIIPTSPASWLNHPAPAQDGECRFETSLPASSDCDPRKHSHSSR